MYSDEHQIVLAYLRDTKFNTSNILIWTSNFNIRDSNWDPSYPYHSVYANTIREVVDSLDLDIFTPTQPIPTRYADNEGDADTVIDLMFLQSSNSGFNNHYILPELRLLSDHTSLCVTISIIKKDISISQRTIPKDSNEEKDFISRYMDNISQINTGNILSTQDLEDATSAIAAAFKKH